MINAATGAKEIRNDVCVGCKVCTIACPFGTVNYNHDSGKVKTDPLVSEGKAERVKAFQDATAAVDSSGLCVFTTFAWSLDDIAPQIDAACEGEWSTATLLEVGERIWNLERDFNLKAGLTAKDDTLPPRLLREPANVGPAKGRVNELDRMLPE